MRPLLLAILVFSFITSGCKRKELEAQLAATRDQLAKTEADLSKEREQRQSFEARVAELETELAQINAQLEDLANKHGVTAQELAELRAEKAKREKELKVYKDLFSQLKALVDAGTIEVIFRKGRMVVKLSNAILFDSGKARLRTEGLDAVARLVPALKSVGNREFLVAGHTDNVPIRTARYKNNWELSTARAVAMVTAMIEQGYPANQLGAAGFGEFDPIGDNAGEEGREQNRRIEIILMPNLGEIPGMKEMLRGGSKS